MAKSEYMDASSLAALVAQLQAGGEAASMAMEAHIQTQVAARARAREEAAARKARAARLAAARPPTRQWLDEVIPETTYCPGDGMANRDCPVCLQPLAEAARAAEEAGRSGSSGPVPPPPPDGEAVEGEGEDGARDEPSPGFRVRTLPCGHGGCLGCVDNWLLSGATACPLCRATVLVSTAHAQLFEAAEADKPDAIRRILGGAGEREEAAGPPPADASSAVPLGGASDGGSSSVPLVSVDASPPGARGLTALMVACGANAVHAAAALLACGAGVHHTDDDGLTPLLHACWGASSACAALLLDAGGACPDTPDAGGEGGQSETPAMVAARLNDVATLRALFARGADLAAVDENGTDALAKARDRGQRCAEAAEAIEGELRRREARGSKERGAPHDASRAEPIEDEDGYDPDELD